MTRLELAVALVLGACGNSSNTPDAHITLIDSKPAIDAAPDALVCTAPQKLCTAGSCTDTSSDEQNCGDCGHACQGGAACTTSTCACPASFLPANLVPAAGDLELIQAVAQFNLSLGLGGTSDSNGLLAVVSTAAATMTTINTPYTLTGLPSGIPTMPVIAALYKISGMSADAQYAATSGTVTFTVICAHELRGTLTNATFKGVTGNILQGQAMVDPNGCTFTMPTMAFDISDGTACP